MTANQEFMSMNTSARMKFYKDMHHWFLNVHRREPKENELILMIALIVTNNIQDIQDIINTLKEEIK